MTYRIHRKYINEDVLIQEVRACRPKAAPSWLGNFEMSMFGEGYGKGRKLPNRMRETAQWMEALHPEQTFTTAFVQTYKTGSSVKKHRDPKSNIGYTLVGVFGEFTGAETTLYLESGPVRFTLGPGDVLSLACTIDGVQGVPHEVSEVLSGTRYALILNTLDFVTPPAGNVIDELFE